VQEPNGVPASMGLEGQEAGASGAPGIGEGEGDLGKAGIISGDLVVSGRRQRMGFQTSFDSLR
jgi:hypothetical protein